MTALAAIAFAGTPEFAVPTLRALAAAEVRITAVLTQPDRPAGRGRRLAAPPVKRAALELGLDVHQPLRLRDPSMAGAWGPRPRLLVVAAYGLLLPTWLLDWPELGCVNVHASLLPRWRGAAPIQRAVLAGDAETGISIMRMEEGLDTGPVYLRSATPIGARETAGELHDRLAALGAQLAVEALPGLLDASLRAEPQDERLATYARKIDKAEARLDWRDSARALERRVRAFNPWPVAVARLDDGRELRIWRAEALPADPARQAVVEAPGAIVGAGRAGIDVATADGVLRLLEVQPPSGRAMDAAAYLAAHSLDRAAFV
ncbi:MAG TPA: methionyl-tRNA formyltransferase [Gammaproteobacteria bacterium]|nr:methionyl-tRNA formyltransferase [Gammaproteobacteria bacterium]